MPITDAFILPPDVLIVPVTELPSDIRDRITYEASDWAIARPRSRTPARILSEDMAALLQLFRKERTIIDAVIEYSKVSQADPTKVLEQSYPALKRILRAKWLAPAGSKAAESIEPSFVPGAKVGRYEIVNCVQALEDTEPYQARTAEGERVALKIAPDDSLPDAVALESEAQILSRLGGFPAPKLLEYGEHEGRKY